MPSVDLGEKAHTNLRGFVHTLTDLIHNKDIAFDVILSAGDSGYAMTRIAEMVYEELGRIAPPAIVVPIFRFEQKDVAEGQRYDNSSLIAHIDKELTDISSPGSILFVDDEIEEGSTLTVLIDLIQRVRPDFFKDKPDFYVVAEDHGFSTKNKSSLVSLHLHSFAQSVEGVCNAISYIIPPELEDPILVRYPDVQHGAKERMNALLNLPIKTMGSKGPEWSRDFIETLEREIPGFEGLQADFEDYLRKEVRQLVGSSSA